MHDKAELSNGSDPTGTITFRLYGPNDETCSGAAIFTSSAVVSGNGAYASASFPGTAVGTYHWVVSYSGDNHNRPAGPTACGEVGENVIISPANPAITTTASAGVTLGGSAYDTAQLSGGANPTGTITFRLYGPQDATCAQAPVFTTGQTVVGNGSYRSASFIPEHAGTYLWVASYSGDPNNAPAASACGAAGETLVVQPSQPTLSTHASIPGRIGVHHPIRTAGQSIYDAATLEGGTAPTGQVTFSLYGPNDATCAGPAIFTSATTVNGNGIYNSERFTPTASGIYRWVAIYSGDANNHGAGPTACDDPEEQLSVTVPADPDLSTTASPAVTLGASVSDTAHLSGGPDPTGTITFHLYGAGDTTCAGTPVFTSTVPVAGNNDYKSGSSTPTTAGVYRWVASYSGDANNKPAGPTTCGDSSEIAYVRPPSVTPAVPALATTASQLAAPRRAAI